MSQPYHESIEDSRSEKYDAGKSDTETQSVENVPMYHDPFGDEEFADVRYRTLLWW